MRVAPDERPLKVSWVEFAAYGAMSFALGFCGFLAFASHLPVA